MPARTPLSTPLPIPSGDAALRWALAIANDVLFTSLPPSLRTQRIADRFVTADQLRPVPRHQLRAHEQADKPADRIVTFGLLLAAGLPREQAETFTSSTGPDTIAYTNLFLDRPLLYLDESCYQLAFSADQSEREHALCVVADVVINANLAALPRPRLLPDEPWKAIIQQAVAQRLLPTLQQLVEATGPSPADRCAALESQVLARFTAKPAPLADDATVSAAHERQTRQRINAMMNAFFGDTQTVEDVVWEPELSSRVVAHGTKLLFLLPGQDLPVFEFGTGVEWDHATRHFFARQVLLALYDRLQQAAHVPVVTHHEQELRQRVMPVPSVYTELGVRRASMLEHYGHSTIPEWYQDSLTRPWRRKTDPLQYPS